LRCDFNLKIKYLCYMSLFKHSLLAFNTFGINAHSRFLETFSSVQDLEDILKNTQYQHVDLLVLGGGSNILFTKDFDGLVLQNAIKGIEIIAEDQETVQVKVGAGESWHEFVQYAVEHGWGGLENMSLIPGTVGAAPMQNIGAYGAEIKDTFVYLNAYHLKTGEIHTFTNEQCAFGYRESIFKKEVKGQYVILNVCFCLQKNPTLNIEYGAIKEVLAEKNITKPGIKDVSDAVIQIRQSKLPNPAEIGNAGSFFKNPEIAPEQYQALKNLHPSLPSYATATELVKIPAGWLIEQAGWKGYRQGQIGVHSKQALVLVNYGGGSGQELKQLAADIQADVLAKFGVALQVEVNFI
jgi:UDP-N-acetylmuramate dehydrogenase